MQSYSGTAYEILAHMHFGGGHSGPPARGRGGGTANRFDLAVLLLGESILTVLQGQVEFSTTLVLSRW